ncbi:MAG: hypothetical protein AAF721_04280 [Myxococcota bacterium]
MPVQAAAAPKAGKKPTAKKIANLGCSIKATAANGHELEGGETVFWNGGGGFPMTVEMTVTNHGGHVSGITNSFYVGRGRGKSAPHPSINVLTSLRAGGSQTRSVVLTKASVADGDHVTIKTQADTQGVYASPGPVPNLPRRCVLSFDVAKQAE